MHKDIKFRDRHFKEKNTKHIIKIIKHKKETKRIQIIQNSMSLYKHFNNSDWCSKNNKRWFLSI